MFRKVPPILYQNESADCGLICVAMVARFHGHRVELDEMRARLAGSLRGANVSQLATYAEAFGLSVRALRAEISELHQLALPAIIHWDLTHFVVLVKVTRKSVVIHDPALGRLSLSKNKTGKHFTGIALELSPAVQIRSSSPRPALNIFRMIRSTTGVHYALVQLICAGIAIEIFSIVQPILLQLLVDLALPSGDRDLIDVIAAGVLLLGLARAATAFVRTLSLARFSARVTIQWSHAIVGRLFRLPMSYFDRRTAADIISRVDSARVIQNTLATSAAEAAVDGLVTVIGASLMVWYSVELSTIVFLLLLIYAALRWARFGTVRAMAEGQITRRARQNGHLLESVRGVIAIKSFTGEEARLQRFMSLVSEVANITMRSSALSASYEALSSALMTIETTAVLYIGSGLVVSNRFSIGMLFAFMSYKDLFVRRISVMIDKTIDLQMLNVHSSRIADIVLTKPEPTLAQPHLLIDQPTGNLSLRNLSFRYSDLDPYIFEGLDFSISDGEVVALTGRSGVGKTTLLKLMASLLEPTNGSVSLGGIEIKKLGYENFRKISGIVLQDDSLFSGTFTENIALFDPNPDQNWVEECARISLIHEDVKGMTMGYNSLIPESGASLSGGQKQRVLLARALYKKPRILFLDEATNNLDRATEVSLNCQLLNLKLTRVIVAHRDETIRSADRVVNVGDMVSKYARSYPQGQSAGQQKYRIGDM